MSPIFGSRLGSPILVAALACGTAGAIAWILSERLPADMLPVAAPLAALLGVCAVWIPAFIVRGDAPARDILIAALIAGALAAAIIAIAPGTRSGASAPTLARGALAVAALTFCIGCVARLLAAATGARAAAGWVLALGCVLAAAPVWLSPALESGRLDPDLVVALNPLSVLALIGNLDYPRTDWLYRHSALGSLRYAYPPFWTALSGYLGLALLALALSGALSPSARRPRWRGLKTTTPEE